MSITYTIEGTAEFHDQSKNQATITEAIFFDFSKNDTGGQVNIALFQDTTENKGTIKTVAQFQDFSSNASGSNIESSASVIFKGESDNYGTVSNATFIESATNAAGGLVTNAKFASTTINAGTVTNAIFVDESPINTGTITTSIQKPSGLQLGGTTTGASVQTYTQAPGAFSYGYFNESGIYAAPANHLTTVYVAQDTANIYYRYAIDGVAIGLANGNYIEGGTSLKRVFANGVKTNVSVVTLNDTDYYYSGSLASGSTTLYTTKYLVTKASAASGTDTINGTSSSWTISSQGVLTFSAVQGATYFELAQSIFQDASGVNYWIKESSGQPLGTTITVYVTSNPSGLITEGVTWFADSSGTSRLAYTEGVFYDGSNTGGVYNIIWQTDANGVLKISKLVDYATQQNGGTVGSLYYSTNQSLVYGTYLYTDKIRTQLATSCNYYAALFGGNSNDDNFITNAEGQYYERSVSPSDYYTNSITYYNGGVQTVTAYMTGNSFLIGSVLYSSDSLIETLSVVSTNPIQNVINVGAVAGNNGYAIGLDENGVVTHDLGAVYSIVYDNTTLYYVGNLTLNSTVFYKQQELGEVANPGSRNGTTYVTINGQSAFANLSVDNAGVGYFYTPVNILGYNETNLNGYRIPSNVSLQAGDTIYADVALSTPLTGYSQNVRNATAVATGSPSITPGLWYSTNNNGMLSVEYIYGFTGDGNITPDSGGGTTRSVDLWVFRNGENHSLPQVGETLTMSQNDKTVQNNWSTNLSMIDPTGHASLLGSAAYTYSGHYAWEYDGDIYVLHEASGNTDEGVIVAILEGNY